MPVVGLSVLSLASVVCHRHHYHRAACTGLTQVVTVGLASSSSSSSNNKAPAALHHPP
jgi:hypothetical protein